MRTYLGKIGELILKGSNIKFFEKLLVSNVKTYLESVEAEVKLRAGRLYITCPDESGPAVEYTLDHLLGITGWALTRVCEKNLEDICAAAMEEAKIAAGQGAKTFKIEAKRSDKSFYLDSYGIGREVGGPIFDSGILKVDVHKPDVTIRVEVRDQCFVYSDKITSRRGLPVGSSGKGLLLLSGGLDSPVAGYRMMRRGMKVECAYFHSYPYTSVQAQEKVEKLAEIISGYGLATHINIIPFTDVQMRIKERAPQAFTTLMLRLCMMKCANILAERIHADCLITGESLGQVASQTIENMSCTESMAEYPLLRPLVGMDKEEIIATALEIGTYETSILPYEDCCVLFSPRHPVLRAQVEEAQEIYKSLEVDEMIQKAFEEREIKIYEAKALVARDFGTKANKEELAARLGKKAEENERQ